MLASDVVEGIEEIIPSFRGLKFSGSDLLDFGQCVSCNPGHWTHLYGVDEVCSQRVAECLQSTAS